MPNVICIGWKFNGLNFVARDSKKWKKNSKKLRFETGDKILNVGSYFIDF
jgi:hypothetical protein